MRSPLIAIFIAAAIAGVFAFLTEPMAGTKSDIYPPAAKGDRLDLRPAEACSVAREGSNYDSDCVRIVDRWLIESAPASAAA
jgi:hypothetical protein